MFTGKQPQSSLFEASLWLPDAKVQRLRDTWAWAFREKALPLIDADAFADLYCADNGRPSKPVETLVAVLILKEMWDLTDAETVYRVDFDLGWHMALALAPEDAHCCQKTLHNFRAKLMTHARGRALFAETTDRVLAALGTDVRRQREDSTHILSNFRHLSRLQLFCETIRLFLEAVRRLDEARYASIAAGLRGRYIKEESEGAPYGDARSSEVRRRLGVCARDVWRLLDRFRGDTAVAALPACAALQRLFLEQCEVDPSAQADADDAAQGDAPVAVKPAKQVGPDTMQTPHDPTVSYGHKGQGYEVQIVETFGQPEGPEIITHVAVTPSCSSDQHAVVPALEALEARGLAPRTLVADAGYGATENVMACAERGIEQISPVPGRPTPPEEGLTVGDFAIDPVHDTPILCPADCPAQHQTRHPDTGAIEAVFAAADCAACPQRDACPTRPHQDGTRTLKTTGHDAVLQRRRRAQETPSSSRLTTLVPASKPPTPNSSAARDSDTSAYAARRPWNWPCTSKRWPATSSAW